MLRVGDDDTDCFRSIHRRTTADRDDEICARFLADLYAMLDVFNGRIRLDIGV